MVCGLKEGNDFPPYLIYRITLYRFSAVYKYIILVTLKQYESLKMCFLIYMQCTHILTSALFNSNAKGKQIRRALFS